MAGSTTSTNFPVENGAQLVPGGEGDAFVAKITGDGSRLVYATYLGGSGADQALAIAVDSNFSVYVTGQTQSEDFPTLTPLQSRCLPGAAGTCAGEAFVTKLTPDGSTFVYSTFLGGSGGDTGNGIAVDDFGYAYIAGVTSSTDFPVVAAYQPQAKGATQAFIAKVKQDGSGLVYSTYLGGSGTDLATSIAVDKYRHAIVSGHTDSADFPTQTPIQAKCHQATGGACSQDAFLTVLSTNGKTLRFSTYLGGSGADEGRGIALDTKSDAYLGGATTSSDFPLAVPVEVNSESSVLSLSQTNSASSPPGDVASATGVLNVPPGGGVVAMLSGLPGSDPSQACTGSINWNGNAGDNQWTTAGNWDTGLLPASSDTVCIGTSFVGTTITIGSISNSSNQTITSLVTNANINFTNGPLTVSGGTTFGATFVNALAISGGTLTLNGTSGSSVGTTLTQLNGATITGTDSLSVGGLYTWSSGTLSTSGTTTASGGISFYNPSSVYVSTGTLSIPSGATATYSGSTNTFWTENGGVVNNAGTWNFQNDSSIQNYTGTTGTFNNSGTFEKTGGTSTTSINVPINNTGTVSAGAADLNFTGGSCSSTTPCTGTWSVSSGATLDFSGGTYYLSGAFSGAGTVNFNGGTVNFTGTPTVSVAPLVNFSAGTVSVTAGSTLNLTGLLTWTGGTLTGSGTTTANGGISFPSPGGVFVNTGTLVIPSGATATYSGSTNTFWTENGGVVNNAGTWNFQNDSSIQNYTGTTGTFNNSGTFEKTGGTGTSGVSANFNNTGTVTNTTASATTLNFSNGGTGNGTWSVSSGDTLEFSGGTYNLSGPISGAGTVNFNGGTVNLTGTYPLTGTTSISGGTVNFNQSSAVNLAGPVNFSSGTLSGTVSALNLASLLTWTGGTLSASGTTASGGISFYNPSSVYLSTGTLIIPSGATATYSGSTNTFWTENGGVVNNAGTWNFQNDSSIQNYTGTTGTFNNSGTFEKTGGTSTTSINVPINNTGTVSANVANLSFTNTYTQTAGTTLLNGGAIQTSNALNIQGGTVSGTGTITGTGSATISNTGGAVAPGVSTTVGSIALASGSSGAYSQGAGGSFTVKLGGTGAGQYDTLSATGAVALSGTLKATLINGYTPALNDTVTILTAASVSGAFTTTNLPSLATGLQWKVTYNPASVVLSVGGPAVSLSAAPTFPSEPVGTTSPAQTVTVTNTGNANLTFTAIATTGPFAIATSGTTCSTSSPVAATGTCTVALTFTPTSVGTNSGSLVLTDNASGSPQTMSLSGTGIGPLVSLSASSLTFPPRVVRTSSSPQTVSLTNTGNAALTILSIVTVGAFSQTNTCPTTLSATANCVVSVTFKPAAAGTATGTLMIFDNTLGSPQTVALSGTGLVFTVGPHPPVPSPPPTVPEPVQTVSPGGSGLPIAVGPRQPMVSPSTLVNPHPRSTTTSIAPVARLSSSTLVFSAQVVGTSSSAQTVTLTNPGDAPVPISSITTSGDFTETNDCGASLQAGAECTISVTFKPGTAGTSTATLSISEDPAGSPQTVALRGTGSAFALAPLPATMP